MVLFLFVCTARRRRQGCRSEAPKSRGSIALIFILARALPAGKKEKTPQVANPFFAFMTKSHYLSRMYSFLLLYV
jgi:hypothetical protein